MDSASSEIDLTRFRELSDGDPQGFRDLVELYLSKTTEQLNDLEKAIYAKTPSPVARMAHSLVGANLMVGMTTLIPMLRELESSAEAGDLSQATKLFSSLTQRYSVICSALAQALTDLPRL